MDFGQPALVDLSGALRQCGQPFALRLLRSAREIRETVVVAGEAVERPARGSASSVAARSSAARSSGVMASEPTPVEKQNPGDLRPCVPWAAGSKSNAVTRSGEFRVEGETQGGEERGPRMQLTAKFSHDAIMAVIRRWPSAGSGVLPIRAVGLQGSTILLSMRMSAGPPFVGPFCVGGKPRNSRVARRMSNSSHYSSLHCTWT